ncbi:MAG TPA: marine proteobacterial sortase target protein [Steroidobacteraceae bacterium]|nr:marine proteobacterial sortase target protein [Steroidobacteraceae bacterium]
MGSAIEPRRVSTPIDRNSWAQFTSRRGTGCEPFAQRLARARLLFLRRRETTANWLALALAISLYALFGWTHTAHASPVDGVRAGSLLLRNRSGILQPAVRVDTAVEAQVSGMIARVTVRQQFRNDSSEWMDAVYVFPLSEKAAVDRLEMHVAERIIVGEIREREVARQVFESARQAGQQASLVEQERANLFTSSIANVPPGETVAVEIGYLESLDYSSEQWSLRIPLTITPRYNPGESDGDDTTHRKTTRAVPDAARVAAPVHPGGADSQRASIRVSLDAGFRLAKLRSLHHPVQVSDQGRRYAVQLVEEAIPADRDFELVWSADLGATAGAAVFTEQIGRETYALLMLVPPHEQAMRPAAPREVIFIIDTSGSMQGPSILQAKAALALALDRLQPTDRFNVIQFNSLTETLFPEPVVANAANLEAALDYVAALEADNGTEMLPALEAAFAMPASAAHLRQIVFITDGAVGNEEQLLTLIKRSLGRARLFTVGIGAAPNGHFMRGAAGMGRGTFTFIGSDREVRERMGELFEKIESPALTDIELRWPDGLSAELALTSVPDVYYGEPVILSARLVGRVQGLLSLTGRSDSGYWLRQVPLAIATPYPGVASLWARSCIDDLLDQRRAGADPETIRREVLELALAHRLVSPYTSLVAVDRTPVRPAGVASGKAAVPHVAPAGSAWSGATVGYPATATPAPLHVALGAALLFLGLLALALARRERA